MYIYPAPHFQKPNRTAKRDRNVYIYLDISILVTLSMINRWVDS